jgi:hypothetical protein
MVWAQGTAVATIREPICRQTQATVGTTRDTTSRHAGCIGGHTDHLKEPGS